MKIKLVVMCLPLLAGLSCASAQQPVKQTTIAPAARNAPVAASEMAPDFTLADQTGQKVTLSSARGQMPVLLVFYRGYW